jgi:hypothetical protein
VVSARHVNAVAAALAQARQPGAESEDKPFAEIERAKQQPFDLVDRLTDGLGDTDRW